MKIGLIGAGNLATQLGKALKRKGHDVVGVFSRTEVSAESLAEKLSTSWTTSLSEMPDADLYIFSVSDAALPTLVQQFGTLRPHSFCLHTAGSMPLSVFSGKVKHYGVLYPMQTFSKARDVDFKYIPCFVEAGDENDLFTIRELAQSISSRVIPLSSEQRQKLHLAAVFACNFVNHCYNLGAKLAEKADLPFDVLLPLIDETASKVHTLSPQEAQTGPAIRYDKNVLEKQEAALDEENLKEIYQLMSKSIHDEATGK